MSRPWLTTFMIRRTAFVRILTVSLPSPLIPETAVRWIPLTPSQRLAHRIMLINLLHLLGMVKTGKSSHGFETRPAHVILPLSPNHGNFGNDWLYSESKLGLRCCSRDGIRSLWEATLLSVALSSVGPAQPGYWSR